MLSFSQTTSLCIKSKNLNCLLFKNVPDSLDRRAWNSASTLSGDASSLLSANPVFRRSTPQSEHSSDWFWSLPGSPSSPCGSWDSDTTNKNNLLSMYCFRHIIVITCPFSVVVTKLYIIIQSTILWLIVVITWSFWATCFVAKLCKVIQCILFMSHYCQYLVVPCPLLLQRWLLKKYKHGLQWSVQVRTLSEAVYYLVGSP